MGCLGQEQLLLETLADRFGREPGLCQEPPNRFTPFDLKQPPAQLGQLLPEIRIFLFRRAEVTTGR